MKLKILGPVLTLLLLVGGVGVSAASSSNDGIPGQLTELQTAVSNLVNEVKDLIPLKDELNTANSTISEQQTEIDSLKKEIADLKTSSSSSEETTSPEIKQALIKEVENRLSGFGYWDNATYKQVPYNITKVDVIERNGKLYLQIFTEGNYDWSQKLYPNGNGYGPYPYDGNGRTLAETMISTMDQVAKLYEVNLHYEFYQNGEKINFTPGS